MSNYNAYNYTNTTDESDEEIIIIILYDKDILYLKKNRKNCI